MKNLTSLRTLIREMIEEKYNSKPADSDSEPENLVPNTNDKTAITAIGDPLTDIELNALVKNIPMGKKVAKLVATTKKPA